MVARRRLSSLGGKFTKILTAVFFIGIIVSGLILSVAMRQKAEGEIVQRAEMLIQTMNAVRSYTSSEVRPHLADDLATATDFIPETVPAYSAREKDFAPRTSTATFYIKRRRSILLTPGIRQTILSSSWSIVSETPPILRSLGDIES